MAVCQLYRSADTIEKVLAGNGKNSKLYPGLKQYLEDSDIQKVINAVPYLQDRLQDGSLVDSSIPEIAAGLWSIVYTPEYQQFLSTLPTAARDSNGEPLLDAFLNHIVRDTKYTKPQLLDSSKVAYLDKYVKGVANALQWELVKQLQLDPENPIVFDEKNHKYYDLEGNEYFGITKAIGGEYQGDSMYGIAGSKVDKILQTIVQNGEYSDIKDLDIDDKLKREIWNNLQVKVDEWTADGSVLLSQVLVSDRESKRASAIDILAITPHGTMKVIDLKTGVRSVYAGNNLSQNYVTPYEVKEGSKFKGQSLSLYDKHGIQVNTYRKFLEKQGYEVDSAVTFHTRTQFDSGVLVDVSFDSLNNEVEHQWGENADRVNTVLPGEVPVPYRREQILENITGFEPLNLSEPTDVQTGELEDIFLEPIGEVINSLDQRLEILEQIRKTRNSDIAYTVSDKTFNELSALMFKLRDIQLDALRSVGKNAQIESRKQTADVYKEYLQFSLRKVEAILRFLEDPKSKQNDRYLDIIANAEDELRFYKNTIPRQSLGPQEYMGMAANLVDKLAEAEDLLKVARHDATFDIIASTYGDKTDVDTIVDMIRDDLSTQDMWAGSADLSRNPVIATMAKTRSAAIGNARQGYTQFNETVAVAGAKFLQARGITKPTADTYSFMTDGNGNYVQRFGQQYKDLRDQAFGLTKDHEGKTMEYIQNPTSDEDLQYNIDLWYKKQEQREFWASESYDTQGFTDGQYHKYNDDFKQAREIHERPVAVKNDQGKLLFWKWVRKEGISDKQWTDYRVKYYDKPKEVYRMQKIGGVPTGRLSENPELMYFPKRQYTEVRDISSTGKDLRDPKWVKLMNPQTAEERANSEFYNTFIAAYNTLLTKLPLEVTHSMKYVAPRIRTEASFSKNLKQGVSNFFSLRVKTNNAKLTPEGLLDEGLPIFYVGDIRNNKKVQTLQNKLDGLKAQYTKNQLSKKEYAEQKSRYSKALAIEKGKIGLEDMETDPVKALTLFSKMAFEYEELSRVENTMLSLLQEIKDTKFAAKDPNGKQGKGEISGEKSNAYKKAVEYMVMNYYQNDPASLSYAGQITGKFMHLTSLSGVAGNVVGQLSNWALARTAANVLTVGGKYFSKKAYLLARKDYNTDYLANRFKNSAKNYYEKRPRSMYEALVVHFNMFVNPNTDAGRVDLLSLLYAGNEGPEFMVQTETGIAYIRDYKVSRKPGTTGPETKKLRDIFTFDPNSGKLTQDTNYEFTDKDRQNVEDTIRSINKLVQGNYAREDRVMLQKYWLGNAVMQFHKHIPTAIKDRFGKHYVHPDLGDIEGRYRTLATFVSKLREFEGTFLSRWNDALVSLRPDQIANLKKDLAEATYIVLLLAAYQVLSMIADGVDDDDENLKKFVNYLKWQDSRLAFDIASFIPILGTSEQWQQIKGPVASLRAIKDYSELLKETALLPAYLWDEGRTFQSGPHRGDSKFVKEWLDVVPALNNINRWENFSTVTQHYIK